jgi:hypothetical protein
MNASPCRATVGRGWARICSVRPPIAFARSPKARHELEAEKHGE